MYGSTGFDLLVLSSFFLPEDRPSGRLHKSTSPTRWAPTVLVINGVITFISRIITPVHPFIRPFIGVITLFTTGRGSSCTHHVFVFPRFLKRSIDVVRLNEWSLLVPTWK